MVASPHNDRLVISSHMNKFLVKCIEVDMESYVNLITSYVLEKLGLQKRNMTKVNTRSSV